MKEQSNTTSSNASAKTLTIKDIRRAVKLLQDASKHPFITDIRSRYPWWKLIRMDATARSFSLWGGILCLEDSSIPPNIARLSMSDGTFKDVEICNSPTYLSSHN